MVININVIDNIYKKTEIQCFVTFIIYTYTLRINYIYRKKECGGRGN